MVRVIKDIEEQTIQCRILSYQESKIYPDDVAALYQIQNLLRLFILHYLVRKIYDSRHPLPNLNKVGKKSALAVAEVYFRAWKLAEQIYIWEFKEALNYPHPFIWWGHILNELVIENFHSSSTNPNLKKDMFVTRIQSDNKKLTQYENIFDPDHTFHTWQLIESSIKLAEKSDVFRSKTWRPFLKARRKIVEACREYPDVMFLRLDQGRILGVKPRTKEKLLHQFRSLKNVPGEILIE